MDNKNTNTGTFVVSWDETLGVGRCAPIGVTDEATALGIMEGCKKLIEQHNGGFLWLVDLTKNTGISSNARKILARLSGDPKIKKIAFVGASITIRVISNFIVAAAGKNNSKHFGTEAEAIKWLKE